MWPSLAGFGDVKRAAVRRRRKLFTDGGGGGGGGAAQMFRSLSRLFIISVPPFSLVCDQNILLMCTEHNYSENAGDSDPVRPSLKLLTRM